MGLLAYHIHPMVAVDENGIDQLAYVDNKFYYLIDTININYPHEILRDERVPVDIDENKVNIAITVNGYETYDYRLLRSCLNFTYNFTIDDLSRKNDFSDNIWDKCYQKVKESIISQNTENIKTALNLSSSDSIPVQYQHLLGIDDHLN